MAITRPYTLKPIKIASATGSGTLTFAYIKEPKIMPNYTHDVRMQNVSYTRPSSSSPGKRIFGSLGGSEGFMDLPLELPWVTPSEVSQLLTWYYARPGVTLVTIDGGDNRYYALWKENGIKIDSYYLNQREFYKVKLDFMIIGPASIVFDDMTAIT